VLDRRFYLTCCFALHVLRRLRRRGGHVVVLRVLESYGFNTDIEVVMLFERQTVEDRVDVNVQRVSDQIQSLPARRVLFGSSRKPRAWVYSTSHVRVCPAFHVLDPWSSTGVQARSDRTFTSTDDFDFIMTHDKPNAAQPIYESLQNEGSGAPVRVT
jgi:hypothetical protein